ncbi:MAG TPA: 2Fe-2S iron-sulfur cluster-binding protein [Azospirillum sp.]|nr:2Fe-2S iron-sulfur cluster-binding protein [Azospirillum sp.]
MGGDTFDDEDLITISVLGTAHAVPAGVTLLNALRKAGRPYLAGCGCRVGACGECATTYRLPGNPALMRDYACVVKVEPGMQVLDVPFGWALACRRAQDRR